MPYVPRPITNQPTGAIPKLVKKKHTFRVFSFLGTIMVLTSLAGLVGMFAYKQVSETQLADAQEMLAKESGVDNTSTILELELFNQRILAAEYLIENHLAPSKIFAEIEKIIKQSVQINNFTYTYDPGFQAILELGGGTSAFSSVASQNIEFMKNNLYTDFVLEDISTAVSVGDTSDEKVNVSDDAGEKHLVTFSLKGDIDTSIIKYTGDSTQQLFGAVPIVPNEFESTLSVQEGASDVTNSQSGTEQIQN
ncbi:MAG TPA: hypothetical protein VFV22_01020 [Candidatus Paceibacterota bacterium]|nr:hypothetical protein [Candidatus Paceibacterota bacterium]